MPDEATVTEIKPVYIPWKTFEAFLGTLKKTTVPHTIDRSVKPSSMAGGTWGQVVSAFRFLGLIDDKQEVQPALAMLVKAYGTDDFGEAVGKYVIPAYDRIIGDLPIENATSTQLDARFREHGKVTGQMLAKATRFFLHSKRVANQPYSSLFSMRRERGSGSTRSAKSKEAKGTRASKPKSATTEHPPDGMITIPVHLPGKPQGQIIVPQDIDDADCEMIDTILRAYARRRSQTSA